MLDTTIREILRWYVLTLVNENANNDMNIDMTVCLVSETGPILYMFLKVINRQ